MVAARLPRLSRTPALNFDEPAAREYARNFFRSMWVFDYFWFRTPCPSEDKRPALPEK